MFKSKIIPNIIDFECMDFALIDFECEPPDLLEVGPSSVRTYHRLDMPSATDIPAILESRL